MRSNVRRSVGLRCAMLPIVAGVALSAGCLFAPKSASAQSIQLTYLAHPNDSPNNVEEVVTKTASVTGGIANISINTDYIDDISVQNGSAFIVEPTVDPRVTLQETLYNLSGKPFLNLTYTLPDGLYFKQSDTDPQLFLFGSPKFGNIYLSDPFVISDTSSPDFNQTVFRTVTFAPLTSQTPLANGQSANFTMTFYTPAATSPATPYTLETIPYTAPEPGSIPLFATACLPLLGCLIVRARKRNEA